MNPADRGPRVDAIPLRHGLTAIVISRCPHHPVDPVDNSGNCNACTAGDPTYPRTTHEP